MKRLLTSAILMLAAFGCHKESPHIQNQISTHTYSDYWNDLINEVDKIPDKEQVQNQISQMRIYNKEEFRRIVKSDKIVGLAERIASMNSSSATKQDFLGQTKEQILFKLNRYIYLPTKIEDSMKGKRSSLVSFGCYTDYQNSTTYCRQESVAGAILCGVTLEFPPALVICALAVLTRESICFNKAGDAYYKCLNDKNK